MSSFDNTREFVDKVAKIYAGDNHSFAITEDGKLWAWGLGSQGQLGVHRAPGTVSNLFEKNGQ